jgi:hypothetical protein
LTVEGAEGRGGIKNCCRSQESCSNHPWPLLEKEWNQAGNISLFLNRLAGTGAFSVPRGRSPCVKPGGFPCQKKIFRHWCRLGGTRGRFALTVKASHARFLA